MRHRIWYCSLPKKYTPHPDFQHAIANNRGLVDTTLGSDGTPVPIANFPTATVQSASSFRQWYHAAANINIATTIPLTLTETAPGSGVFAYTNSSFFPIDGKLLGNEGQAHNYSFTLTLHSTFNYAAGQVFNFVGDDDVWVFIITAL